MPPPRPDAAASEARSTPSRSSPRTASATRSAGRPVAAAMPASVRGDRSRRSARVAPRAWRSDPSKRGRCLAGDRATCARRGERAPRAERADLAPWDRTAHLAAEVHDRLVPLGGSVDVQPRRRRFTEDTSGHVIGPCGEIDARPHALDVRVHRGDRNPVREARHSGAGVLPDPGQAPQRNGIARHHPVVTVHDLRRGPMQGDGAAGVTEPAPRAQHVAERRRGQRRGVREALDERLECRCDAHRLGLLQHDLAHQHGERIGPARTAPRGSAPGVCPSSRAVPGEQRFPSELARARLHVDGRRMGGRGHDGDP